ncbi:acetolactate synthase large subunit [Bordetella genomosp. 9]|uniref:acetolactate synthase large subunit n=1 Tax=Bordetella genomosp. 9 TaxID=1416803 RepID=UPI000A294FFA|nr:acetolactate synthase large subunit [Bordetella genomosp. 9]ARP89671.1 acetolactate synthase large subunit [Bordetella genomosp. 9]
MPDVSNLPADSAASVFPASAHAGPPAAGPAAQNGAQWLLRSAAASGLRVCFANPGTTELPFVAALDHVPQVRPILSVFEGVCSGAADGYFRISRMPAMTLTHLGPGFANAIANLHNARRARSRILNVIGEHMSWHLSADPPLASDIESLARPVSAGVWRADSMVNLQSGVQSALREVLRPDGGIASLVLPMDMQQGAADWGPAAVACAPAQGVFDESAVRTLAQTIRQGQRVLLFLGAGAMTTEALTQASRFAQLDNVDLIGETFPARSEHGGGLPSIRRFSYLAEQGHPYLLEYARVALVDALPPVAFFGAQGYPSYLGDPARMTTLSEPGGGGLAALRRLADSLGLQPARLQAPARISDAGLSDDLTAAAAAQVIAANLPDQAIVSVEGGTIGFPFNAMASQAARHSTIVMTGGAIGQGLPAAFGASIAAPDRKVVALQSDGSALYTAQALWSMARERANVVVVIAANRRYQVLQNEMQRTGHVLQRPDVQALLDLSGPSVDWVQLSRSLGVPAAKATTTSELRRLFHQAVAEPSPFLIEAVLP